MEPSSPQSRGCFLIGCGPSLRRVDVRKLAGFDTITFNRSYIAWDQWGFHPAYYACFDEIVLADNLAEIQHWVQSSSVRYFFLNQKCVPPGMGESAGVIPVTIGGNTIFSTNWNSLGDFGNVGASSLQILAALGYRRIAMVGVDARYADFPADGEGKSGIVLGQGDQDHFSPDYNRGKRKWANPDPGKILGRWPKAAKGCRELGIDVRNASPESSLECFELMEFEDALSWIG